MLEHRVYSGIHAAAPARNPTTSPLAVKSMDDKTLVLTRNNKKHTDMTFELGPSVVRQGVGGSRIEGVHPLPRGRRQAHGERDHRAAKGPYARPRQPWSPWPTITS